MSGEKRNFIIGCSLILVFVSIVGCLPNKQGGFSCIAAPLISKIQSLLPTAKKAGAATQAAAGTGQVTSASDDAFKVPPYTASAADIKASNDAVTEVASAIKANNAKTVTSLMAKRTLSVVTGSPDLSGPEAASLAKAMSSAHIVKAEPDAFVYQTNFNGTDITFLVIKEDGTWKIAEQ
jgi:hypothetical protein